MTNSKNTGEALPMPTTAMGFTKAEIAQHAADLAKLDITALVKAVGTAAVPDDLTTVVRNRACADGGRRGWEEGLGQDRAWPLACTLGMQRCRAFGRLIAPPPPPPCIPSLLADGGGHWNHSFFWKVGRVGEQGAHFRLLSNCLLSVVMLGGGGHRRSANKKAEVVGQARGSSPGRASCSPPLSPLPSSPPLPLSGDGRARRQQRPLRRAEGRD